MPESPLILGVEIGGTKLQLGISDGTSPQLLKLWREDIVPAHGATGIMLQIERLISEIGREYSISQVGIGFGGPVDSENGRTTISHQIDGWENFPIRQHLQQLFRLPVALLNDCDAAALAEATWGAGKSASKVFYVTVGTGIGGGFVIDGQLYGADRPSAAEIGHLRPGIARSGIHDHGTVESIASGWGIVQQAQRCINSTPKSPAASDLRARCNGQLDSLTGQIVAQAALDQNQIALEVLDNATTTLGWAIAQMLTLLAAEVVVVGGGVTLMEERLFLTPLAHAVDVYVFPPLRNSYSIKPAALGEEVVVHGAIIAGGSQAS